ncbi:hypothetical protein Pan241w_40410 [Gimesia alba]|uniref:Uncharacterized protein n=1 Tax=Gimesia alba TaxID=2527973 RepID=A0A517RJ88_9PLAN|nr:hypothetical protein [Gimesia alba]QDT43937.1 hypothetical protein Pan241w_40410 [Gimesia alba]
MAVYYLLSMLAVIAPGKADFSVDELFTIYQQNHASFVAMELDCFYHWGHSDELPASIDAEIDYLKKQLQVDDLPVELIRIIEAKASPGSSFQEAKQQFIAHREMMRKLELRAIIEHEHIFFRMTPEQWDLHLYQNAKMNDLRQKSAVARGLKSFTGGDFQHVQRKVEGGWLCLEPYPYVNSTYPVACSKTIWDTRQAPLPLFLESGLLKTESSTHWNTFWDEPEKIQSFGSWIPETGGPLQLLIKPFDNMQFQFVALDVSKGAMPQWSSLMQCIDDHSIENLTPEIVSNLAAQIEFFRNHSTTNSRKEAVPLKIIFFDDYQNLESAGWYPFKIMHKHITLHPTEETYREKRTWRHTPFGIGGIQTLQIKSIAVNDSVSKGEPLKLPANTIILDLDTENNTILDDTPVKATDRFMTRLLGRTLWGTVKRNAAVFIGGMIIFCLIGFLIWRRLKGNSTPASEH